MRERGELDTYTPKMRKWTREVLIPLLLVMGVGTSGGTALNTQHEGVSNHQAVVTSELIELRDEVKELRGMVRQSYRACLDDKIHSHHTEGL